MSIRKQMRAEAEKELSEQIDKGGLELKKVIRYGVTVEELAQLIGNTRTDTLRKKIITRIANGKEQDLLRMYNDQRRLELSDKKAKAEQRMVAEKKAS